MVIFYALMSALTFGAADFLGGFSSRKNSSGTVVAWSQLAGLLTVSIAAPLIGSAVVPPSDILWGMAAGICGALGVWLLFHGLATGLASIVSPVAAISGAALPVLFGFLTGERPPLLTWMGVACSLPAILLLSYEKGEKKDHVFRSLQFGFLAGVAFGGFYVLLSCTSDGSGLWPLVAARSTTVPLFFGIALIRGQKPVLSPGSKRVTLLSGFLDMIANVFYLLAVRTGYLIFAVILSALYPAPTVMLQRMVFKEKLTKARIVGLVLSITGAALIGIGG